MVIQPSDEDFQAILDDRREAQQNAHRKSEICVFHDPRLEKKRINALKEYQNWLARD